MLIEEWIKDIYVWEEYSWQPGSNTVMYYPLTSSTTTQDKSGNGYNMTNKNSATFWTYHWVNCVHFEYSVSYLQYDWNPLSWTPWNFTVSNRFYVENTPSEYAQNQWSFGYWGGGTTSSIMLWWDYQNLMLWWWNNDHSVWYTFDLNKWYHVAVTYTPWNVKTYVNGTLVDSWSKTYSWIQSNYVRIWRFVYDWDDQSWINWCISEFILENKTWTESEIQDYFNAYKSLYGIS